jgi:hypothetical protein
MKTICLIICFGILGLSVRAQTRNITQTVRGTIVDKYSNTTIPGANIVVLNTDPLLGTITDENGNFRIEHVPIGRQNLQMSYLGYETVVIPNVVVGSGKEVVLNIEMSETVVQIDEVEINGNGRKGEMVNQLTSVSGRSFTVDETKRYAGSFNDPSRMAMSYAGVTPNVSGNNDLIIRGNSPQGLLWRMEGVEIPNPNHFGGEGATGGPISMLNSDMMANSDFFTGAFPAEYGNCFSGVFDIKLRQGNNQQREHKVQLGVLGVDLATEGPFKKGKQSSYLVNYRYSSLALLQAIGFDIVGDAIPKYQDLTFKVHLPTKNAGVFSVYGLGGLSTISFEEDGPENVASGVADVNRDMITTGMNHVIPLSKKTFLSSSVNFSGLRNRYTEMSTTDSVNYSLRDKDRFDRTRVAVATNINHKFNAKHFLKSGVTYSWFGYDMLSEFYDGNVDGLVTEVSDKGNSYTLQGYTSWNYRINEKLTMNAGVHLLYFGLNNNYSVEPRAGVRWQFHPRQSFSAGFGVHSRVETLSIYLANGMDDIGNIFPQQNRDLGLMKARHFVLGYDNFLTEDLYFKAEVYFQQLYDVPIEPGDSSVYSILNQYDWFTTRKLTNDGKGYNYGLEMSLEKYFSRSYYFMVTTSLFNSQYQAGDGAWRNTVYNSGYVLNLLGGKEFKIGKASKNRTLTLSAKGSWAGGHYYTPVDLEASREALYTVVDESKYLGTKASDFIRFDIKASLRRDRPRSTHVLELDIQNVTNNLSPVGQYYDAYKDKVVTYTSAGMIPVLSYRIEF